MCGKKRILKSDPQVRLNSDEKTKMLLEMIEIESKQKVKGFRKPELDGKEWNTVVE